MSTDQNRPVTQAVRDLGQRLLRFIRARVPSDADAEDISQDVWQQLVVTLESGPIQQMSAWLYTVARHRIIDRQRKTPMVSLDAMADAVADDAEFAFEEFLPADDHTPRTEHARNLFWEQLHGALAELPEEQRQVFMWHEFEDLSFQDIATLTGENVNTLLARKRYAVLRLRQRLEPLRSEFSAPANR